MIDQQTLNLTLVEGLEGATGRPTVKQNGVGHRPEYPFLTFTVTSPALPGRGTYGEDGSGYCRELSQVWSITALSCTDNEALTLALKARDFLERTGRRYLSDHRIAVRRVGGVNNRDTIIACDYEYRYGFDVTFAVEDIIFHTVEESTETIDTAVLTVKKER